MYKLDNKIIEDLKKIKKEKGFENLYLYLSNECDYHCKHCYLGDRLVKKEFMEVQQAKKYLETFKQLGSEKVCFIGGEPTLYSGLEECVDYAVELGYKKIIVGSNGSSKASEILLQIKDKVSYIQISLDGATRESNDYIRNKGAYDQTIDTIKSLVDANIDTRIIMTVNSVNVNEVLNMIDLGSKLKVQLVKFHIMSEIGNAKISNIKGVSPEKWIETCNLIQQYTLANKKIKVSYQPAYAIKGNSDSYLEKYQGCVGKNLERISVFPDGKCYICSFLFDFGIYYAEQNNNCLIKCKNSEYDYFTENRCDSCDSRCGYDGCVAEDIVTGGRTCLNSSNIYPVCRLWKVEI